MKKAIYLIPILLLSITLSAETVENRLSKRHEVRIGIGDPMADYAFNQGPKLAGVVVLDNPTRVGRSILYDNPSCSGHLFAGYHYRINSWLSLGLDADCLITTWDNHFRDSEGAFKKTRSGVSHEVDLYILPSARFTYFSRPWVNIYSGISFGGALFLDLEKTYGSFAFNMNLLGISVGRENLFAAFELGYLTTRYYSFLGTRYLSLAVGYRF